MPADLRETVERRIRSGERDAFGVIDRGVVIDKVEGKLHCVLEAPDAEAVMSHHEALGSPIVAKTIHEADIILR